MKKSCVILGISVLVSVISNAQNNSNCGIMINEIQIRPGSSNNQSTMINIQQSREWIELFNNSCDTFDVAGWYIVTDLQNNLSNPVLGYSNINSWAARYNNMPVDLVNGPLITNTTLIPPKGFAVILTPSWNSNTWNQYMVDIPDNTIILTPANYNYWGSNFASGSFPPNGLLKNDTPGDFVVLYDGNPLNGANMIDSVLWTDVNGLNASLQRDDDGVMRWHSSGTYINAGNYDRDNDNTILARYTMGTENFNGQGDPCNYLTDFQIPDSICLGASLLLNNTSTGGGNFFWNFGDGDTSTLPSPAHSYSTSGTYSIVLIQSDQCYTDSVAKTITVLDTVHAMLHGDTLICEGNAVTLSASGGSSYTWSTGEVTASITVSPSSTTTYWVIIANGICNDSLSATVQVQQALHVQITGPSIICKGDSAMLSVSGGSQFLWSTGDTTNQITVFPVYPELYMITVSDGVCSAVDSFHLDMDDLPMLTVSNDREICFGQGVEISAQISNATSFQWSNGSADLAFTDYPEETTAYIATAANWCGIVSDTVHIIIHPLPEISAGEDVTIHRGETAQLHGSGGPSWNWNPEFDLDCATCQNPIAQPEATTTYSLTVVNGFGCSNSDEVTVFVSDLTNVYIPNAFTPNNDGFNDIFTVKGIGIEELSMLIFDRWGETIYQSDELKAGWDGTVNGNPAPVGTYVYEIEYKAEGGSPVYKIGKITLVK